MSTLSAQAEQARENARKQDGKFGSYHAPEADFTLISDTPHPETSELMHRLDDVRSDHPEGGDAELKVHPDGTCELIRGQRRLHIAPRGDGYQVTEQTFDGERWTLAPEGGVESYTEDFDMIGQWGDGMLSAAPHPEPAPAIADVAASTEDITDDEEIASESEVLAGVSIEDIIDDDGDEIGQTAHIGEDSVSISRAPSDQTNSGYRGYQVSTHSPSGHREDSTMFFEQLMIASQYSQTMIDEIKQDSRQWGEVAY